MPAHRYQGGSVMKGKVGPSQELMSSLIVKVYLSFYLLTEEKK